MNQDSANQSAQELLQALNETSKMANQDVFSFPLNIRDGMDGVIRQAKEKLVTLKKQYAEVVGKNLVIIPVVGEKSEEFAKLASSNFGVFSMNYYSPADETTERLLARRMDSVYVQSSYSASLDDIYLIKNRYNISKLPFMVALDGSWFGRPLKDAIRQQFNNAYGNELYSIAIREEAGMHAAEIKYDGTKMPVVVYNYNEEMGLNSSILSSPEKVIKLDGSEELSPEFVMQTLSSIKNKSGKPKKVKED